MCRHSYRTRDMFNVPVECKCNSCITCLRTNRTFWYHRILSDVSACQRFANRGSSFVTLTLAPKKDVYNPPLDKRHLTLFWKLARKRIDYKLNYYAIGDYGGRTQRTHYHAILIGVPSEHASMICRRDWLHGFYDVEPAVSSNINYVVSYMQRQNNAQKRLYEKLGYQAPFATMSHGIGYSLFTRDMDLLLSEGKYWFKGRKYSLPPYWKAKFATKLLPLDFSQYEAVASRLGFPSPQDYLEYRAFVAEQNALKRARNKFDPPQGLKNLPHSSNPVDIYRKSFNSLKVSSYEDSIDFILRSL